MSLLGTISTNVRNASISLNDNIWVTFGLGFLSSLLVTAAHPLVRGGLIGFFPYAFSRFMPRQGISLGGYWYALYVENGRVRHEVIKIRDSGDFIKGEISLEYRNNHYKYSLSGKYENEVLIATYVDKNHKDDERGVIITRRISENLLYGYASSTPGHRDQDFCHGPYLMARMNLKTRAEKRKFFKNPALAIIPPELNLCADCKENGCCCSSEKVDMPVMFSFECNNIQVKSKLDKSIFSENIKSVIKCDFDVYRMKSRKIEDKLGQKKDACYFYDGQKCTIYRDRPIDCRLFPFDIKVENNEFVFGYHNICSEICGKNKDDIEKYNYFTRPYIYLLRPYIKEFSSSKSSEKLRKSFAFNAYNDDFFIRTIESCGLNGKK